MSEQQMTPAPKPAPKNSTALIVVLVVLVLVVAGLGGWFGIRPLLASPSNNGGTTPWQPLSGSPAADYTHPANPVTVPFDPTAGLDAVNDCSVMGVWSDIAVVIVDLKKGSSVVRGIDVTTGQVKWTYEKLPDGNLFQAFSGAASGDRLAMALDSVSDAAPGTFVVITSLTSGDVLSSRWFPDATSSSGSTFTRDRTDFSTYQDGIVVLDRIHVTGQEGFAEGNTYNWDMTEAYKDTDMATPLWQVKATGNPGVGPETYGGVRLWYTGEYILGGRLVLTASWFFNDLHTGEQSHLSLYDGKNFHTFTDHNGVVIEAVKDRGWGDVGVVNGWTDPMGAQPAWTYAFPAGWVGLEATVRCTASDLVILASTNVDTGEVSMSAVGLADGRLRWSVPGARGSGQASCAATSKGDQELVAIVAEAGVSLIDAANGKTLGTYPVTNIHHVLPCGSGAFCAFSGTDEVTVTRITYDSGSVSSPWTGKARCQGYGTPYQTQAGWVILTEPSSGKYEWLIV